MVPDVNIHVRRTLSSTVQVEYINEHFAQSYTGPFLVGHSVSHLSAR